MATIKKVTIEVGREYAVCDVVMTDGVTAKVIAVSNNDGSHRYVSESAAGEPLENLAERVAKNAFAGILDAIVGGDE